MSSPPPVADPATPSSASASASAANPRTLHIGTRASALALAQTRLFTTLLSILPSPPATEIHPTTTAGDHNQTSSLHALAATGKSLWTHELEAQLLTDELDCIVHSLKDVPTKLVPGCVVRAVGAREDPRDVLVMRAGRPGGVTTLQGLLDTGGGVVGTSSVRRAAMIRRRYPGLRIQDVRGNVGTRLRKLDAESEGYDCLVLAGAGVLRLGLGDRIASWLGRDEGMLHAVGQGALGVEFREGDGWVESLLAVGEGGRKVAWACAAERMLLGCLEGGCSVPVGVETNWEDAEPHHNNDNNDDHDDHDDDADAGILVMRAMVLAVDGSECVEGERRHRVGSDAAAEECGFEMAKDLVARGAGPILEKITLNRAMVDAQGGA
ncbi:porphobilinogen deaminase [Lobaria immixta]|nr:porphobilinogen deaminase [Lobaria immixta]